MGYGGRWRKGNDFDSKPVTVVCLVMYIWIIRRTLVQFCFNCIIPILLLLLMLLYLVLEILLGSYSIMNYILFISFSRESRNSLLLNASAELWLLLFTIILLLLLVGCCTCNYNNSLVCHIFVLECLLFFERLLSRQVIVESVLI